MYGVLGCHFCDHLGLAVARLCGYFCMGAMLRIYRSGLPLSLCGNSALAQLV